MKKLEQELVDKSLEANYHLWHALLTVNSLIATIFVAMAAFSKVSQVSKYFVLIGFFVSTYACLTLLMNFVNAKVIFSPKSKRSGTEDKQDKKNNAAGYQKENDGTVKSTLVMSALSWILLMYVIADLLLIQK